MPREQEKREIEKERKRTQVISLLSGALKTIKTLLGSTLKEIEVIQTEDGIFVSIIYNKKIDKSSRKGG